MIHTRHIPDEIIEAARKTCLRKAIQKGRGNTATHDFSSGPPDRNFYRGLKAEWALADILGVECRWLVGKPDLGYDLVAHPCSGTEGETVDVKFRTSLHYGIPYDTRDGYVRVFTSDYAALMTPYTDERDPWDLEGFRCVRWVGWISEGQFAARRYHKVDHKEREFDYVPVPELYTPDDWFRDVTE